jgi:hypothetical protein
MKSRMLCLPVALCGLMLMSTWPAAAKTVPMRPVSRNDVESVCRRAGGSTFGTTDDAASYGCNSHHGSVVCTPDGKCLGYVSDLLRMPSNSPDAILGAGVSGRAIKVGPADRRIMPTEQH